MQKIREQGEVNLIKGNLHRDITPPTLKKEADGIIAFLERLSFTLIFERVLHNRNSMRFGLPEQIDHCVMDIETEFMLNTLSSWD